MPLQPSSKFGVKHFSGPQIASLRFDEAKKNFDCEVLHCFKPVCSVSLTSIGAAMAETAAPDFNVGAKGSWAVCFFGRMSMLSEFVHVECFE